MTYALTIALLCVTNTDQWPQFRGPAGQGVTQGDLPIEWSETSNIAWRCELPGVGHSSPVIWSDTAWLTTATPDGSVLSLVGVDLASGRLIHSIELFRPTDIKEIHHDNSYASPTPCVDAERVYAHFGRYGTAAVSTKTGEVVWRNNEVKVWHNSGPASSIVLAGGRLILTFDAMEESFVCGLDPAVGEIVWKTPRSAPLRDNPIMRRAFSTPLILKHAGQDVVVSPGPDQMNCYVARTGKELWHIRYTGFSTVPVPTTDGTRLFYCTGYTSPELRALNLAEAFSDGASGLDVTAKASLWSYRKAVSDTPSPTYHDGRVWMVSDKGVLTAVDALTGERVFVGRVRDNVSASPIVAGNQFYVFGKSGATTVWDTSTSPPSQLARNILRDGIKATPAVVENGLLTRTERELLLIAK